MQAPTHSNMYTWGYIQVQDDLEYSSDPKRIGRECSSYLYSMTLDKFESICDSYLATSSRTGAEPPHRYIVPVLLLHIKWAVEYQYSPYMFMFLGEITISILLYSAISS